MIASLIATAAFLAVMLAVVFLLIPFLMEGFPYGIDFFFLWNRRRK
jgi:hypothetical protein